ncbi:uncharacterized protein LDX57_009783 [Aspergillus melleus]|uniref:uncharacterized protein n=1 Tax=Aspergillus melleus TaxID=138277 RepID=UPI001E8D1598|nr:uncharacterized protein LDX57_009783 [Aspergillus melleus]KAH8432137.1 hypothetical protein LDX57_009783 [Aspergillus melleus]
MREEMARLRVTDDGQVEEVPEVGGAEDYEGDVEAHYEGLEDPGAGDGGRTPDRGGPG